MGCGEYRGMGHNGYFEDGSRRGGAWVYGEIEGDNGCVFIRGKDRSLRRVYPETVGRYIDVADVKDRKIYEDDIVEADLHCEGCDKRIRGIVRSVDDRWVVVTLDGTYYFVDELYNIEVVGNVYDNADVLTVGYVSGLVGEVEARALRWERQGSFSVDREPAGIEVWVLECDECGREVEAADLDELRDVVKRAKWGLYNGKVLCPLCLSREMETLRPQKMTRKEGIGYKRRYPEWI